MGCSASRAADADVPTLVKPTPEGTFKPTPEGGLCSLDALCSPTPKAVSPASSTVSTPDQVREERAALKLGAAVRGYVARTHLKRPCKAYRVNVKAETFGDCLCGWAKAAHSEAAHGGSTKGTTKNKLRDGDELRATFMQREMASCTRYVVNMSSQNFGECMCGRPKADHTASALAACDDKGKSNVPLDEEKLRATFVQRETTACTKYVVNMQATSFGECICGVKKADHTAEALNVGKAKANALVDGAELRKTFVQKEKADCKLYIVNLQSARFGECVCGAAKADHTAEALGAAGKSAGATVPSPELRRKFVKAATVECLAYEVDMLTPDVPFGTCLCGAPKAKHSEAALRRIERRSKDEVTNEEGTDAGEGKPTGCDSAPTTPLCEYIDV